MSFKIKTKCKVKSTILEQKFEVEIFRRSIIMFDFTAMTVAGYKCIQEEIFLFEINENDTKYAT